MDEMTQEDSDRIKMIDPAQDTEKRKAGFDETQKNLHVEIRELLWMLYPTEKNMELNPADDPISDQIAAMIVEGISPKFKVMSIAEYKLPFMTATMPRKEI